MRENEVLHSKKSSSQRTLVWSARALLALAVLLAFNFNFEAFRAGAESGPIVGEGTPKFIAKWVGPGAFDYNLTNSGNITVAQGSSGSNIIAANLVSGTPEPVDLWVSSSLPSGATYSMEPSNSVVPTGSRTLFIYTTAATPLGTYPVTVTGSVLSGKTITFDLTVNPPAPESSPQCGDGIDNDGDGVVDFSGSPTAVPPGIGDPGCLNAEDENEQNNPIFEEVEP